jgi:hypothetical protein
MRIVWLAAAAVLLLGACRSVPENAPGYRRAPDPPPPTVNLYIYRLGLYGFGRTPTLSIDGVPTFQPPQRSYTVIPIKAGTHQVDINWGWDVGSPDLKFSVEVPAGPSYLKISEGTEFKNAEKRVGGYEVTTVASTYAFFVPQPQAEAELRKCCRYVAPIKHKR